MNNDLISRSELKKAYFNAINETSIGEVSIIALIDNAPAVELFCSYLSDGEVRQPCVEGPCEQERPQDKRGKWVISEIQCPICFEYFQTDCYSTEELKKCPSCGAVLRGAE